MTNGKYTDLSMDKIKKSKDFDPRISVIGQLSINDDTYTMIPNICNYYLETTFFVPQRGWDEFRAVNQICMMKDASYLIKNGFADLVFVHADSGSFFIEFDTRKYSPDDVINAIDL
jgi:hypothetical protein